MKWRITSLTSAGLPKRRPGATNPPPARPAATSAVAPSNVVYGRFGGSDGVQR